MKRVRKTLKKYFIPHEENDHKPHILRAQSVAFVLLVAFAMELFFWFGVRQLEPNSQLFGIIVTNSLIDGTNQSRTANNLAPLQVSPLLQTAAQEKADDMATNGYFAHTSPAGLTPWYWFDKVGYQYISAGENLAVDFSDSKDVTTAWMNSPEHRANILNGNYTQIGMATAQGTYNGHPTIYVVEFFGTPVPAISENPFALLNSAAASAGTGLSQTQTVTGNTVTTTVITTKTTNTKPITKPVTKPVVKPISSGANITKGNATTTNTTTTTGITKPISNSTQTVASVKGASIEVLPVATTSNQLSNAIQQSAANPRRLIDTIYLAIIALFALSLILNFFIKIRIQHPQIIFGGMLVVLVVGLLIVLNVHMFAGAVIL